MKKILTTLCLYFLTLSGTLANEIAPQHGFGSYVCREVLERHHEIPWKDAAKNWMQGYVTAVNRYADLINKALPDNQGYIEATNIGEEENWNNLFHVAVKECRDNSTYLWSEAV